MEPVQPDQPMRACSTSNPLSLSPKANPLRCYKYVTREANFQKAQENCVAIGGSMVSVTNAFENAYIAGIVETISSTQSYWIGLTLLNSTQWSWINGDNSTYLDWAGGQQRMDPNVYQCAAVRGKDNEWT